MREDQGGVYGVSISGSASKYPLSRFSIMATWGCNPENITRLSQTVLDEMSKIRADGPTELDLNKVKETLIRERETRMKENSFWMSMLTNYYYQGDKLYSLEEYKSIVNSITQKDIKAVADLYLNTKSYVQVELTPAPKN
jgi:zinc protease